MANNGKDVSNIQQKWPHWYWYDIGTFFEYIEGCLDLWSKVTWVLQAAYKRSVHCWGRNGEEKPKWHSMMNKVFMRINNVPRRCKVKSADDGECQDTSAVIGFDVHKMDVKAKLPWKRLTKIMIARWTILKAEQSSWGEGHWWPMDAQYYNVDETECQSFYRGSLQPIN